MDVLFLTVSAGDGHTKAAEAVKEVVEKKYKGSRTLIVDTLKYVNPIFNKLVVGGYLNTVKNNPRLYAKLYGLSESSDNINDFSKSVLRFLSSKIKHLIDEFNPSVIVCTHPFPLQMLSYLKSQERISVPVAAIITDFAAHSIWLLEGIDAFIVPHEFIKFDLAKKGVPEKIIYPLGIPVSQSFLHRKSRFSLLMDFGLSDKLTLLVMGGSLGFGEVENIFTSLLYSKSDLQIIAVTGKNIKLNRQLEALSLFSNKKIKILSYTNKVSDLMDVSNFIITKPGGMTIAESLVKELPMFLISPIPGQEEKNAHFLINNGAASRLLENDDIDSFLHRFLSNPLRVSQMRDMAKHLSKPNSSVEIVSLLEELAYKKLSVI